MLNLSSLNQRVNALTAKINNIVPPTSSDLADVLLNGNSAGATDIDMNSQAILNASSIELIAPLIDQKNTITNNGFEIVKTSTGNPFIELSPVELIFSDEPTQQQLARYTTSLMEITNLAGTAGISINDASATIYNPAGNDYSLLDINSLEFADASGTVTNSIGLNGMAITGAGTISATSGLTVPSTVDFTNAIAPTCIANPQNGLDLCNKNYVDSQSALTAYQLYFNYSIPYTVPGGATYKELSPLQVPSPTTIAWTTNSTAPVLLGGFFNLLTGLNIPTSIPAGVWTLLIYANLTNSAGQAREAFFYEIYGTTALGAEVLLYGSPASLLLNTVSPLIGSVSIQGTVPLISLIGYTGLGLKLYIEANTNSNTSGSIFYQTPNAYSSVLTSFAVVQAPDLLGLNNTWTGTNNFTSTLLGNLTGTTTNLAGGLGGSIPYQSAVNTTALLPNGSVGQVLTSAGTTLAPTWTTLPTTIATATNLAGGIASQIPYQSSAGTTAFIANGTVGQVLTSAGTSVPTWSTVPATTLANVLLAGNSAGATDINMNTRSITGASSVSSTTFTGALTGNASTATQSTNLAGGLGGSIPYQSALNTTALLANGTAGQVLTSAGTTLPPTWDSAPATSLSAVMAVGNSASTSLNMATFAITNAGAVGATSLTTSGNSTIAGLMVGTGLLNTNTNNTAFGLNAMDGTTTGVSNVAIGINTLRVNTSGGQNTACGRDACGTTATSASNNTGVGYRALWGSVISGTNNSAIGVASGGSTTTGANNTYLGATADQLVGTYNNSTAVGFASKITASNQIQMGTATETVTVLGYIASRTPAGDQTSVNFGVGAGKTTAGGTQNIHCVAIGNLAGSNQARSSTHVGYGAGQTNASGYVVAIGNQAGNISQGGTGGANGAAVAVGSQAGYNFQGQYGVAIGQWAGINRQGAGAVAIGYSAGQGDLSLGAVGQGAGAVAIGQNAGEGNSVVAGQGANAVAVGRNAGNALQGGSAVAIGNGTGQTSQGSSAVAIGISSGQTTQGASAIAIGNQAGQTTQSPSAIAIGNTAGRTTQGSNAVAIGISAGTTSQGSSAIAIGAQAGNGAVSGQGANAIAIGNKAGESSQTAGSICLNASGVALNPAVAGLHIDPIRNDTTKQNQVQYNTTSKEVSYVAQVVSPITTSGLDLTGNVALLSGTSGSTSGQHLVIVVNGVTYKIELRNV